MKWIVFFIITIIIWVFSRFVIAYIKQRNEISANGGIKIIYKVLVDGLLNFHDARIIQDNKIFVTIGGTIVDPFYRNRECGIWSVIVQPTFNTLTVKYRAHIDLGGGETANQIWSFPIHMEQTEMLDVIKKEANQWNMFGIFI